MSNIDKKTVSSFSDEWTSFKQNNLQIKEHEYLFNKYFSIFPWKSLPKNAEGFDMGCGSGRWAKLVSPKITKLSCIDASAEALSVAKQNLREMENIVYIHAGVSDKPLPPNSQDFGYSLGVLHHIPDTSSALRDCVEMLKPGAPFLVYLYYKFDNRPLWYVIIWRISDIIRRLISNLSPKLKLSLTNLIAALVYLPLARIALIGNKIGFNVDNWPLSGYRKTSFYTMRTDSRDRFGTPLEKRFTKTEIKIMMENAGLEEIYFSDEFPFWCATGYKK